MPISLDELKSHLFKCSDIIRDAVDPTDYKEYILPLVHYKGISDEFGKQYEQNLDKYGDDFACRKNLYSVPLVSRGHSWKDVRAVSDNVDQALNEAFDALTKEKPELKGIFERTDYMEADALGDKRFEYEKLELRNQRTRWGNCTTGGTISLNRRLIMTPADVVDYLVVHELAHLTEQHHGREFWKLVGEHVPDYRAKAEWLEQNSARLIFSEDDV